MRSRGYEHRTILDAEHKLKLAGDAEIICAQIESAFSDTVLGDGIGLWEAQGLDDYEDEATCAAYRDKDEKLDWKALSLETLQSCNSSPSFLDADGFRFYLPAFMCADLREDYGYTFHYSLTDFSYIKYSRYTSLSLEQRAAIRSYLIYQRDHPENRFERDTIQKALDSYWTEESCKPSNQ